MKKICFLPLCLSTTTMEEEEVRKLLKDIDVAKTAEPDEMHPLVLHELRNEICKPLTFIFNSSLASRDGTSNTERGKGSVIFKKGDKNKLKPGNYRPVSLTSIFCKLMEKLIRNIILEHLKNNNLISNKQFGFVSGRSTTLQLIQSLMRGPSQLMRGNEVDVIYMDFQKAFNTVPQIRLVQKLKTFVIGKKEPRWVESFL